MLDFIGIYPDNSTQKVFPRVISHLLDTSPTKIEPIINSYMPLDRKGRYVFSSRAFKEAFPQLTSKGGREFILEDISHLRVIMYGNVERKMTLGTFVSNYPEGDYILILENGYTVGLSQGKILANQTVASRPKSRLFRIYKLITKGK
jgi:hypothetical protein